MRIILNVIIYQAIWFLCVFWGNIGALAGCVLLALHILFSSCKAADLKVMAFAGFLGLIVDGTLQQVGFFTLTGTGIGIPYWLLVIWLGLGTTPNHSLKWLQNRIALSVLFGAIGGPAAYYAGARLGAATFHLPFLISIIVLAALWGLVFPAIMLYCKKGRLASDAKSVLNEVH